MATAIRTDRPRGSAQPRGPPRRAAHPADRQRARCSRSRSASACGRTTRCCTSSTNRCKTQTQKQVAKGQGTVGQAVLAQQGLLKVAQRHAGGARRARPAAAAACPAAAARAAAAADRCAEARTSPRSRATRRATTRSTLGVGEPFTTTLTVALYFALIISLPVILFELYGFILPALTPHERRVGDAAADGGPVPVRGRRRCSATSSCCRPRCASS